MAREEPTRPTGIGSADASSTPRDVPASDQTPPADAPDVPEEAADQVSDQALLERHTAGDPDAFGILVTRHRTRLWAVALRTLGGDREEAADALQDALVSAFRAARTFQGRAAVSTWLYRIVTNACLDRVRRDSTHPTVSLPEHERLQQLVPLQEPADVSLVRTETHQEVLAALRYLPHEQRAALVLVDMEGYSVSEAATVLDVAPGTVKSRRARGRAKLLPRLRHLRATRTAPSGTSSVEGAGKETSQALGRGGNHVDSASVPETAYGCDVSRTKRPRHEPPSDGGGG